MYFCLVIGVVFFFKQKTAYEMRISDWSSDVCSSDLVAAATESVPLGASGASAYLDQSALLKIAAETGATHVHPGYGFLSENAEFAHACTEAGIVFVGPDAQVLRTFGDTASARTAAVDSGVQVLPPTSANAHLDRKSKSLNYSQS